MRTPWRHLEGVTWAAGIVLVAVYALAQFWIERDVDSAVATFREVRDDSVSGRILRFTQPDTAAWSASRVASYNDQVGADQVPRAVLRIAALALEVPVYVGVTEWNLNRGAAWIDGTAPFGAGNTGLAAHRDGYFRGLQRIRRGDRIEVETLSQQQHYRVTDIRIVSPNAVEVLDPTAQPSLTLVTCYPFYQVGPSAKRFIVRAERIGEVSVAPVSFERS
jgi:sortase A